MIVFWRSLTKCSNKISSQIFSEIIRIRRFGFRKEKPNEICVEIKTAQSQESPFHIGMYAAYPWSCKWLCCALFLALRYLRDSINYIIQGYFTSKHQGNWNMWFITNTKLPENVLCHVIVHSPDGRFLFAIDCYTVLAWWQLEYSLASMGWHHPVVIGWSK